MTGVVLDHKLVKFALRVMLRAMDKSSSRVIFHQSGTQVLPCRTKGRCAECITQGWDGYHLCEARNAANIVQWRERTKSAVLFQGPVESPPYQTHAQPYYCFMTLFAFLPSCFSHTQFMCFIIYRSLRGYKHKFFHYFRNEGSIISAWGKQMKLPNVSGTVF